MEIIYEKNCFKLIKNDLCCHVYKNSNGSVFKYQLKSILYNNFKRKQKIKAKKDCDIEKFNKIKEFLNECKMLNLFESFSDSEIDTYKNDNFNLLNEFYKISCNFGDFHGENNTEYGQITIINEISFLIPPKCKFFNKNVIEIKKFLPESEKFDFIVIDPPWKCRYIKRLKKTFDQKSYNMMTNDEISNISLRNYTHKSSIVIIWATNSETHENFIKNSLLEKWDLKQIGIWHWIKVDKTGDTFCSFEGNKKPYEKIFIATHSKNDVKDIIEKEISIVSQSSSIHSHKPQLLNLFRHILPAQPKCLELFARSLYEHFTSIGTEVLKLQNCILFEKILHNSPDQNFLCDELVQQQKQSD